MTHASDLPRPTIAGRARVAAQALTTRAKYAAGRAIFRHRYEYETDIALREIRARLFGDPALIAAAANPQTFYAPETAPNSYGHEWSEGDARNVATLAHALRRAPKATRDAFTNTTRHAADAIKEQRAHFYYSTFTCNAARDLVDEVADSDEYREAIIDAADSGGDEWSVQSALDYSGGITERIDGAVPVYTHTLLQVLANDSDVSGPAEWYEPIEDAYGDRFAAAAIYAAIEEQVNDILGNRIAADLAERLADRDERDEALSEVEEYADALTTGAYEADPNDHSAAAYFDAI